MHDVPIEYDETVILRSVIELNLPDFKLEDVKLIYMYPARDEKKHRSCVVEIKPACRKALEGRPRIYIKWQSCRFADYVSTLQCYQCLKHGHKAGECKNPARCGHCAGEHNTNTCTKKSALKCHICVTAKIQNSAHSAFDKSKCTMLRNRIERKIHRIDYG